MKRPEIIRADEPTGNPDLRIVGQINGIFKKLCRPGITLIGVIHNTGPGLFLTREILDSTGLSISGTVRVGEGAWYEILIPHVF